MPYIDREARKAYDADIAGLLESIGAHTPAGDMNYLITRLLSAWLEMRGVSYASLADVVKVLETAKLEFYRRVVAPYENRKIEENGDVYGETAQDRG